MDTKKYRLKINYTQQSRPCLIFTKGEIISHNTIGMTPEFVNANPDIFEEIKPLFWCEDFPNGTYPEKSCKGCSVDYIKERCQYNPCKGYKPKGQAIYEGDKCWKVGEFNTTKIFKHSDWVGYSPKYFKYFSNEQNAREYYASLQQPEYYTKTVSLEIPNGYVIDDTASGYWKAPGSIPKAYEFRFKKA